MATNTGKRGITRLNDGRYCWDVPAEYQHLTQGKQKVTRGRDSLPSLVKYRNSVLGFNPDLQSRPVVDLRQRDQHIAPYPHTYTFGVMADQHIGHIQEDVDALRAFIYEAVEDYGVKTFYTAGNWIDGDKFPNENYVTGLDNQISRFLEVLPYIPGVQHRILDGDDHEGWYQQRHNVFPGQQLVERQAAFGRDDLFYLGYLEASEEIVFDDSHSFKLGVMHGGGGTSIKNYGLAAQSAVDQRYHPSDVPDILLLGHYHKLLSLGNYRGCHVIMPGSFVRQSYFTRKQGTTSMIGGYVVTVGFNGAGRLRVIPTPLDYSSKGWSHNPNFNNHFIIKP